MSPNKLNLKYDVIDLKSDYFRENFVWLIQLLNKHGVNANRALNGDEPSADGDEQAAVAAA